MEIGAILGVCVSALLLHSISGQCVGNAGVDIPNIGGGLPNVGPTLGTNLNMAAGPGLNLARSNSGLGLGSSNLGYGNTELNGFPLGGINSGMAAPTSGGSFTVTSSSPIAPTGISVMSENVIEGPLVLAGQLPFLGAVAVEGQVPAGGSAGVQYGCGNGNVGIVSEGVGAAAGMTGAGLGIGASGLGGSGLGGYGLANAGLGYSAGLTGALY